MRQIVLFLASVSALLAQTQTKLQPDCSTSFQLSAVGTASQFDNRTVSSATGVPCRYWTISYYSQGFAAISLLVESAQDSNGTPGSFSSFGGTVVNGVNPNTSTTSATTDLNGYFPWMRIHLTSATGSGAVRGTLNGYRTTGTTIAGGGGAGGSGYNQIQNNMVNVNFIYYPDGFTPVVIGSQGRTSFLTATSLGFFVNSNNSNSVITMNLIGLQQTQ